MWVVMNNDYKKYIESINNLKVDLNILKKNNNNLQLDIKNKNNQVLNQMERDIELLENNSDIKKENIYIKDALNKMIESLNNTMNILNIIYQKNLDEIDNSVIKNINKIIISEIEQLNGIIEHTNKILTVEFNSNTNKIVNYCNYICENIFKTKTTIDKLLYIENNKSIDILKGLLNDKIEKLNNIYEKLAYLVFDNNNIGNVYNEYQKYGKRIIKLLKDSNDVNSELLINKIKYSPIFSIFNISNSSDYNTKILEKEEIQRFKDTEDYKNNYSLLNKSFWDARYKAFSEKIKYPSVLFEKKVKEYQNDYLIEKYNKSLEEIENSIDEYRKKYSKEIYMDEVYEEAVNQLKNETLLTIDEMCDESLELSQLDKKAYIILNDRLMDVIRKIGYIKADESLDDFIDLAEYKKNAKLNELLVIKDIIEYNMNLIIKKRDEIEK